MNKPTPPGYGEFSAVGCRFEDDEGYVSYGDSSGTEITALPWPEAVKVFAIWWKDRRAAIRDKGAACAGHDRHRELKVAAATVLPNRIRYPVIEKWHLPDRPTDGIALWAREASERATYTIEVSPSDLWGEGWVSLSVDEMRRRLARMVGNTISIQPRDDGTGAYELAPQQR